MSDPIVVDITEIITPISVTVDIVETPYNVEITMLSGPLGPAGPAGPMPTVSGTGWAHVTDGAWDAAASTPTADQVGAAPAYLRSTGIVHGGQLSINADATRFDIAPGALDIVDTYTTPLNPTVTRISWTARTGILDEFIATADITYVAISAAGNVVQSTTLFTADQLRDVCYVGATGHHSRTQIDNVSTTPSLAFEPAKSLEDFLRALGQFCVSGNVYYALGGLYLGKTAGKTFAIGRNYAFDRKNPHVTDDAAMSAPGSCPIVYAYRNSAGGWTNRATSVLVDPDHWDDGSGTLATVPNNKYTIQLVYYFAGAPSITGIQYGQVVYASLDDAKSALMADVSINPATSAALFRAWIIVQKGTTSLTSSNLYTAGKFGRG